MELCLLTVDSAAVHLSVHRQPRRLINQHHCNTPRVTCLLSSVATLECPVQFRNWVHLLLLRSAMPGRRRSGRGIVAVFVLTIISTRSEAIKEDIGQDKDTREYLVGKRECGRGIKTEQERTLAALPNAS